MQTDSQPHTFPLYYRQHGHGAPLILLHGWGFNQRIWDNIAQVLSQQWTVYQVDLPGHGNSPLSDYAIDALSTLFTNQLPDNAVWIGWSLGGLLAQYIALHHPHKVRALVLLCSSPKFVASADWSHAIQPKVLQQFYDNLQANPLDTVQRFLALQVRGSDAARAQLRQLKTLVKDSPPPQSEALMHGLHLLQRIDLRAQLAGLCMPALQILGGKDTLVPYRVGAACQNYCPQLRKLVIKPAAHIPFLSHPEILLPHLQGFLHDLSPV